MSYTMNRAVPKDPNPFVRHATTLAEAVEVMSRQMHNEIRPENGYKQAECVQRIEFVSETDDRYNFKIHMFGD